MVYQHIKEKQRGKMNAIIKQGEFLCVQDFVTESLTPDHFKAVGYVSLLVMSKSDFMSTLIDYPDDHQKYAQLKDNLTFN